MLRHMGSQLNCLLQVPDSMEQCDVLTPMSSVGPDVALLGLFESLHSKESCCLETGG